MPPSPLQSQYPLSSKKFWKKLLQNAFSYLILLIFLAALVMFFLVVLSPGATALKLSSAALFAFFGWLIILGLNIWYIRAYIRLYFYSANENFITIKKKVFAPTEIHVQYAKIQDVYVDQDILDRIMGLYDVHIASATGTSGIEAHIDGVEHDAAEGLKNLFLAKIQGASSATSTSVPPAAGAAPIAPVSFSEEVSIKTYPIAGRWVWQRLFGALFHALWMAGIITFYLIIPGKNSTVSLAESFHFGGGAIAGVFAVLYVFCFLLYFGYALLWRSSFSFQFLPEYIVMRSGVISRSEMHVPYHTVQDVLVSQSILERMFGLASVKIQNAAAAQFSGKTLVVPGVTIPGQTLEKANKLSELVKGITLTKNSSQTGL